MKKVLISTLLLTITVFFVFAEGEQEEATTGFSAGKIIYLEGNVTINGQSVDFGTTVASGSTIKTGPQGICDIVFGGKNILRFYENTTGTIDFSKGVVDMQTGSLGAVLQKLTSLGAGHGNKCVARSPQVVGGVRGTSFFLKIEDETSSYLCICNGDMQYQDVTGSNRKRITSDHHKAFHYREENGTIKTESAKLLYHDDTSMDAIAAQIDAIIPWDTGSISY